MPDTSATSISSRSNWIWSRPRERVRIGPRRSRGGEGSGLRGFAVGHCGRAVVSRGWEVTTAAACSVASRNS